MQIFHDGHASSFAYGGETYEVDEDGRAEVPHEVGMALCRDPHIHQYLGEPELSAEEIEDGISKAELRARIEELEAELASRPKRAAKKAPASTTE
jgi:hypothetical protein